MSTPNPLPLYTVAPDTIIVSTDVASTDCIIAKLVEEAALKNFFGFDLEIMLSKHVRLVQIATHERAYIFDIDLLGDATADTCVALAIYNKMMTIKLLMNVHRSLWIFTEYNTFNSQCVGLRDDYIPHVAMNPKYIKAIKGVLKKAKTLFQQANNERSGDGNRTWTEQVMPDATVLLNELTAAFLTYHLSLARPGIVIAIRRLVQSIDSRCNKYGMQIRHGLSPVRYIERTTSPIRGTGCSSYCVYDP
ncbi:hypothetical protein IMY05_C4730000100 [Salix suchowensis]|nr:hypothetical protein IMY05_C4730000100 [Salix suchowensis]